ncbi:ATP-binding protein [Bacillus cereus]|uniref:AAA family ATPase n=1 Tax=Bacillus cereus TaxID=1396 RepID=UPI0010BE4B12|nr:AAA family ATPase [Bacillus cereus]TKH85952.1 ATP-binding protein [Bacillus cereus]
MLRIDKINICNINSISNLQLDFQPGVNILCGTNGIGKTTILECISHPFRRTSYGIRKTVNSETSFYEIDMVLDEKKENYFFELPENNDNYIELLNRQRITSRKFIYHNISHRQTSSHGYLRIRDNDEIPIVRSEYDAVKGWFYRCYFKKKQMSEAKFSNFILTKEVFNKLDPSVTFVEALEKHVKLRLREELIRSVEILLETPHGIISMDFMSSGYKACFCILFGIIRTIEERLNMSVEYFDGIVLIDEIDLHLHPEWQTKIVNILKWLIPNSQIIITTHSPHVIQNAGQGEIIPLGVDRENRMFVRDLPESSEYGFQGWTVEEILVHVMGLSDLRSNVFREKLNRFEEALDNENIKAIRENYVALKSMIHYRNPLATLLKIQAEEFFDEEEEQK